MLALHVIAYYSKEIKWSRDRELKWEERDGYFLCRGPAELWRNLRMQILGGMKKPGVLKILQKGQFAWSAETRKRGEIRVRAAGQTPVYTRP